jgi:hypothetical protein
MLAKTVSKPFSSKDWILKLSEMVFERFPAKFFRQRTLVVPTQKSLLLIA